MKENTKLLNSAEINIPNSYCAKCGAYGTNYRICKCAPMCERCGRGAVDESSNGKDEETTIARCNVCNTEFLHDEEVIKSCNSTPIRTAIWCAILQITFAAVVIGGYSVSSAQLNGMGGMSQYAVFLLLVGSASITIIVIFVYASIIALCTSADSNIKITHERLILLHVAMVCIAIAAQIVGCVTFYVSYGDGRPNIYTFCYGIIRVDFAVVAIVLMYVIIKFGSRVIVGMTTIEITKDVYVFEVDEGETITMRA